MMFIKQTNVSFIIISTILIFVELNKPIQKCMKIIVNIKKLYYELFLILGMLTEPYR